MMKTFLFAAALASLALAGGCATGGNGTHPPPVTIDVAITSPSQTNASALYPTEPVTLTATVSNSSTTAVTWSLSGTNCTGSACGTLTPITPAPTPATAQYVAPAAPTAGVTVTATLASDSTKTGTLSITVIDVTTDVAPAAVAPSTLSVGKGLTQTFTAVAVPDAAATQTFTWTCTAGGSANNCANFHQDANVSGLAYYTEADNCSGTCVQISALSTLDPNGCSNSKNCTMAKLSQVPSRVSGTYAFRFSGYDSNQKPTAVAGTFTASNGTITGVEDELTSIGASTGILISGGSYQPNTSDANNSNNAGTLTLTLPAGVYPNKYQVVLDGNGDIEMIESDDQGTGSGIAQNSSSSFTGTTAQTYAFGFTGVAGGSRVGYAGLMGFNGSPGVVGDLGGLMDVNDGGQSSNIICSSTPPCAIVGTYTQTSSVSWHLALSSPVTMGFDLFVASGSTTNKTNPLTFYAISTDSSLPAVSGTMVLQDASLTYNNAAFKGTSVSALTGTVLTPTATCTAIPCANVSLTLGATDGNGNFSGQFDQNNGGAILSAAQFPPSSGTNNYTYAASSSNNGRYTFNMLGDPKATTPVPPLPFVLYASGANRGFLLEQGSSSSPDTSVMTGTMSPQGKTAIGFPGSALPSTFAAATTGSGSSAVDTIAANLLLTWVNPTQGAPCAAACVNGTQYDAANPGGVQVTGANPGYTMQTPGNGTIALTAPSAQNYVIYAVDTSGCTNSSPVCAVLDFLMMDVDKTNPNASIIFAQQ